MSLCVTGVLHMDTSLNPVEFIWNAECSAALKLSHLMNVCLFQSIQLDSKVHLFDTLIYRELYNHRRSSDSSQLHSVFSR